jgi:stage V sporulation protein R
MVINSDPCIAYLMRDNTLLLHVLTIAHVYGHNDFFANNFTFTSGTDAALTLERFRSHGMRVARYMSDPSIGQEAVEDVLDHAHALMFQSSRNLAIKKLSQEEQRMRAWEAAQAPEDQWKEIHQKRSYTPPDLNRVPIEPDEDILGFIANYNPYLPSWKKDLLQIVERESKYFIPQIETKIMNEGWASYWHYKLLTEMNIDQGLHLEFLVRHNQVLRPTPGGLNPYHLGFTLWRDIERRWNEGDTGVEYSEPTPIIDPATIPENDTPGRKKIFEVRSADRDVSFLRRFLTKEIMQELELFQHDKRGKERVVSKLSDEESWKDVKETLIHNIGMSSIPVIKVEDGDFGSKRTLYLKHYHDGRDLQLEHAEHTLRHVHALWEREVVLETILGGKSSLIKLVGDSLKVEKL